MTPRTSPSSRASRRCASGRACTSARPACAGCITSSTRSSTTRSTRRWPATATRSTVTIHPDNSVTVVDDGRGIPVAKMEKEGKPAVEVVLTVLHAGGKFGDGGGYKVSGGLHGVGVSVVNALSERAARRDPARRLRLDARTTSAASPQGRLEQGEPTDETGTTITFLPDAEIFETLDFEFATLEQRLRETAFLTRGLRIAITDERGEGQHGRVPLRGRHRGLRRATSTRTRTRSSRRSSSSRARARRARSRSRCSGTPPTRSRSSRSPTTSTRTRAARTSRASAPRSRARSTATRASKGQLKEKDENLVGRGHPRGPDRRHLGQARRPAVRGPDEDQARQPGHAGLRRVGRQRQARRVPRGEPEGGDARSSARRSQAAQARAAARKARDLTRRKSALEGMRAAGQARRLHGQGPGARRAVHRRGRLRRRLGQAGPRPLDAGRPPAARQDPQRREGAHRQGAAEHGDPGADHGARHRRARRVRPREGCATTRSS